MPASKETKRGYIGYRVPPDIEKNINTLIESKEFDTKADIISSALRFWFENRDRVNQMPPPINQEGFKNFLLSKDGQKFLKGIIRQVKDES
jgi:Arc/MetJ-type ribon-helix-helix transcriptional regulator